MHFARKDEFISWPAQAEIKTPSPSPTIAGKPLQRRLLSGNNLGNWAT